MSQSPEQPAENQIFRLDVYLVPKAAIAVKAIAALRNVSVTEAVRCAISCYDHALTGEMIGQSFVAIGSQEHKVLRIPEIQVDESDQNFTYLEVNINQQCEDVIQFAHNLTGLCVDDIVNKAIILYDAVVDEMQRGAKIAIL